MQNPACEFTWKMGVVLPYLINHPRANPLSMHQIAKKTIVSTLLILVAIAPAFLSIARANPATSYSFNLIGPNSAMAPSTIPGTPITAGDILRLTGSGAFNLDASTASGGGSFTHMKPDGAVFARGTWLVTGFQSFNAYGGPNAGIQGGVLAVTVTLGPFSGLTMQISCEVNAPPGAPAEGTTLPGLFTQPVSGSTLFHQNA